MKGVPDQDAEAEGRRISLLYHAMAAAVRRVLGPKPPID